MTEDITFEVKVPAFNLERFMEALPSNFVHVGTQEEDGFATVILRDSAHASKDQLGRILADLSIEGMLGERYVAEVEVNGLSDDCLWSTMVEPGSTALGNVTMRMFVTPRGQQGQGLAVPATIAETNMMEGGRVHAGRGFEVRQVAVALTDTSGKALDDAHVDRLAAHTVLSFDFLSTHVVMPPLSIFTPRGRVMRYWNYGPGVKQIEQNQYFSVLVTFGRYAPIVPHEGLRLQVALVGNYF